MKGKFIPQTLPPMNQVSSQKHRDGFEVLVVEDSDTQLKVLGLWLQKLGCKSHLATNAYDALEILKQHNIRVVISDLSMDGMDGIELCRQIRKFNQEQSIYIIITTGLETDINFTEVIEAGADDFITKPLNLQFLSAKIHWADRFIKLENRAKEERDRFRKLYKQMESELAAAAELQRELMPPDRQYNDISIHSSFIPASIISGDCQNHFWLPDGRVLAYQADIAGHSLRAALLSATLQRILTPSFCCWRDGTVLKTVEIAERLNERLQSNTDSPEYFTLFLVIIEPRAGAVSFCQAGHPPAALHRAGGRVEWIGNGGFPIGIFPTPSFEEGSCQLMPGDKLMIISDGILECQNAAGDILGQERLERFLEEFLENEKSAGPEGDQLLNWLKGWHGSDEFPDDVSILSIGRARIAPTFSISETSRR